MIGESGLDFTSLLSLMVVVWLFGKVFKELKLPIIFGELIGGVIVGPMALGIVSHDSEFIKILSELGIFFMMLHAGLETDPKELFASSKKSILIALGGIFLPFIGGFSASYFLFDQNVVSSLFIGMSLSITAIAVSVRLFKDCKISNSLAAHTTLSAAIIDDILAFILFSVVLGIAENSGVVFANVFMDILKIVLFFAVVLYLGNKTSKYLPKFLKKKGFTFTLIIALALGLIAEKIGLHSILGAFLAGLFIREEIVDKKIFAKIEDRVFGISYSFLGPIFFASLAFSLNFSAFINEPVFLLVILIVAIVGKIVGAGGLAYLQGLSLRDSLIIGVSMNSRGAVELIIASIGLERGIIDKSVFSVLVLMAFVTTLVSIFSMKPILRKF